VSGPVGDATGIDFDTVITRIDQANRAVDKLVSKVDKVYKKLGELKDLNTAAGGAQFSTPANIPGSANGGNPNMPAAPGSAGAGMNKWRAALNFGAGAANLTSALLPDAAQGINRQQMRFDTAIQMGGASPLNNARYRKQEVAINAAMSGRMANVQSAYQVSQVAATTSIVGQNAAGLAAFAGAGFKNTGIDNAQLAQAHANMATSANFNNQALAMGIRTHDAKGNYLTGDALYSQIFNRLGIAGKSSEEIQTQMASGRQIGNFLQGMGMSDEEKQAFQAYAQKKAADSGYTLAGDTTRSKESPRDSSAALTQATSENVQAGMDAAVEGYNAMNGALTKATEGLTDLYEAAGPLADLLQQANGANVAFQNSGKAQQVGGALKDAGSGLLGAFAGSSAASAFRSGGAKAAAKTIGKGALKGLGRGGPLGLASLAVGFGVDALQKKGREDNTVSGIDTAGSIAGSAGVGALTGGAIGSFVPIIGTGIGAAIGGVIGGALGWKNSRDARKDLEEKGVNPDTGELLINGQKYIPHKAQGDWNVSKNQLAKLHQNEMVLPADVAESFRSAVQSHVIAGGADQTGRSGGMVRVDVTLNNASWSEAQKLVKVVQEAVDTSRSLELLAST
jgi:hypothetical protein